MAVPERNVEGNNYEAVPTRTTIIPNATWKEILAAKFVSGIPAIVTLCVTMTMLLMLMVLAILFVSRGRIKVLEARFLFGSIRMVFFDPTRTGGGGAVAVVAK